MKQSYLFTTLFAVVAICSPALAQRLVEGTIKSEINKQPIPFATIYIKEDNVETYANIQGKYRIEVSDKAKTVYISSAGFLPQEVSINPLDKTSVVDVLLADNDLELKQQIVTANRAEENLQITPVSASVVQAITIQNRNAFVTTDAISASPNVITDAWSPSQVHFSIRGFSTSISDPGIESAVGLYIDDVFYSRGFGFNATLMDIERIEILRGPQGTMFGKNTIGGLVNVITEKPKMATIAGADVNMGSFSSAGNSPLPMFQIRGKYNAMILKNRLAFRLNGGYSSTDGYIKDLNEEANKINKAAFWGFRGALLYQPTPKITIDANAFYSKDNNMQGTIMQTDGLKFFGVKPYDTLEQRTRFGDDKGNSFLRNQYGVSARTQFLLGKNTLNTVTSYFNESDSTFGDFDKTKLKIIELGRVKSLKAFTQEIRYASPRNQKWSYLYGLHFITETIGNHDSVASFATFAKLFGVNDSLYKETYGGGGTVNNTNLALFTAHTLQLGSKLNLNVGGRYTFEKKDLSLYQQVNAYLPKPLMTSPAVAFAYPLARPDSMFTHGVQYSALSGNIGLDYRINDSIFTYVNVSRGFKGAGFNMVYSYAPADSNFSGDKLYYKPEFMMNYEWGFKSQFFNRYRINGNVFYSSYQNKQELLIQNTSVNIANAKLVSGWGAELEASIIPFKGFQINVSGSHLNLKYDDFIFGTKTIKTAAGQDTLVPNDLSGNRVAKAPDWTAGLSLQYSHLFLNKVRMLARADWNYSGYSFNDIANNASIARMPANMVGGRIAFSDKEMRYTFAIWGKNLTNATYRIHGWDYGFEKVAAINPPRMIGVELRYNFFK